MVAVGLRTRAQRFAKHIDATADQFDLEKIKGNAAMSCQIKTKSLCEEIGKLATRAIEQIKDDDLLDKKR